jgi:hypothetical protein
MDPKRLPFPIPADDKNVDTKTNTSTNQVDGTTPTDSAVAVGGAAVGTTGGM